MRPRRRRSPRKRDLFEGCDDLGEELRVAFERARRVFRRRPDVTGVSIGLKHTRGRDQGTLAIRVHVARKIAPGRLSRARLLPAEFERFPVDVVETAPVDHHTSRRDPLQPGISVGRLDGAAGTIVMERGSGRPCILSASHVLAGGGKRRIIQPAAIDGGTAVDLIAVTLRSSRATDASIAALSGARGTKSIALGMVQPLAGWSWPKIGQILEKSGRSTKLTRARVVDIGSFDPLSAAVRLEPVPGDPTRPICKPGDSGAVWRDAATFMGVALHSKGPPDGSFAIATFLGDILSDSVLDIELR